MQANDVPYRNKVHRGTEDVTIRAKGKQHGEFNSTFVAFQTEDKV